MAFPIAAITDIIATAIESRTRKIANNVAKNNALLAKLNQGGKIKTVSGGSTILEELSFAENGNAGWYSGYDTLSTSPADVVGAAQYSLAQAACPVVISGLEVLQNSGKEALIDLLEARLSVAEDTMKNLISAGLYSDGSGAGGKQIKGLKAAIPFTQAGANASVFGGIDSTTWTFWRPTVTTGVVLTAGVTNTVQATLTAMYSNLVRGSDAPDLLIMDAQFWASYVGTLQQLVRFSDADTANLGFPSVKFMNADCVLDGGIGGYNDPKHCVVLNTSFIKFRPHKDRNFVSLSPSKRVAINQDAEVSILAFAGALTMNGRQFHGRLIGA